MTVTGLCFLGLVGCMLALGRRVLRLVRRPVRAGDRVTYIRIRSWHVVRNWTRVPGSAMTLCGRAASGETAFSFGDGKTCESCLRVQATSRRPWVHPPG